MDIQNEILCVGCAKPFMSNGSTHLFCKPSCMKNKAGKFKQSAANYWIFIRDNFTCLYCGRDAVLFNLKLAVDHIRPVAHNGTGRIENLATVCSACNLRKGSKLFDDKSELFLFNKLSTLNLSMPVSDLIEIQEIMNIKYQVRKTQMLIQKEHQRGNDKRRQVIGLDYFRRY